MHRASVVPNHFLGTQAASAGRAEAHDQDVPHGVAFMLTTWLALTVSSQRNKPSSEPWP